MTDAVARRRALVHYLEQHVLVDSVDWTRDGYQTVVLELGEPDEPSELVECKVCGAVGVPERIHGGHDCSEFWEGDDAE